jgi:hypothetical protein
LLVVAVDLAACGSGAAAPVRATVPAGVTLSTRTAPGGSTTTLPLRAPKTTPVQDTDYLADVAKADSDLATYMQQQGNTALKAMLTDGTVFCAFLRRDRGLDRAILDTAVGAKSVESQTQLPYSVRTFNTLDAVALLRLCPSEQSLVPRSVRAKIRSLGSSLGRS